MEKNILSRSPHWPLRSAGMKLRWLRSPLHALPSSLCNFKTLSLLPPSWCTCTVVWCSFSCTRKVGDDAPRRGDLHELSMKE